MRQIISRSGLVAGLCGSFLLGCESAARRPYAVDPLILDKKPVVGAIGTSGPNQVAATDPTPPTPPIAVVSAPMPDGPKPGAITGEPPPPPPWPVEARPAVGIDKAPIQATPVSRPKPTAEIASTPPIRRQVPETYGHATDYGWLQGVLDRHYQGHFDLRYCDASVADQWGGKVILSDDPRLARFKDGDQILVEGEILKEPATATTRRHYPLYRIREIWLVKAGSN